MLKEFWNVDYEFSDYLFDECWNIVVERLTPAQKQTLSDSCIRSGAAIESKVYGLVNLGIAFGLFNQILYYFKSGIKQVWKAYWTPLTDLGVLDVFVYHDKRGEQ